MLLPQVLKCILQFDDKCRTTSSPSRAQFALRHRRNASDTSLNSLTLEPGRQSAFRFDFFDKIK